MRELNADLERRVEQRTRALAHEIDERERVSQALRDSERQLRAILDAEPECVKAIDANGKLLQINAAGLALLETDNADGLLGARCCTSSYPNTATPFAHCRRRCWRAIAPRLNLRSSA